MMRTPVASSALASIGYDPRTLTLEVEFTNGSVHQYFDVPDTEQRNLLAAESIGAYFNRFIRDNYRSTPL